MKIQIENCVYKVHPVYDLYASDENENIINIVKKIPMIRSKQYNGYLHCSVRMHGQKNRKTLQARRFVWECFNGLIPEGKVIDRINDKKDDNRLCNL